MSGERFGHARVPSEAGDVVDDLGAGAEGGAGGGGMIGVDGEDGFGTELEDAVEDGEQAGLLFFGGDGRGVGAGGLGAEIEEVGAVVEELKRVGDGGLVGEEEAAVGEAVGRDVDDAHHQRARPEGKDSGAQTPEEDWADLVR